jgi:peroxiredoxin
MLDLRKIIAIVLVGAASLVLAIQFMRTIEPAAAREVEAACTGLRGSPSSKTIKSIPTQAPDFTVIDHEGNTKKLSDYRGKVVMVNFWASWCETCEAEKPSLQRLQTELGDDDFVVLALASDVSWAPIAKKFPNGSPLTILLDKPKEEGSYGPVATAWGIQAVPESFVVDRNGVIRHYFINKRDWDSTIAQTCIQAIIDE